MHTQKRTLHKNEKRAKEEGGKEGKRERGKETHKCKKLKYFCQSGYLAWPPQWRGVAPWPLGGPVHLGAIAMQGGHGLPGPTAWTSPIVCIFGHCWSF